MRGRWWLVDGYSGIHSFNRASMEEELAQFILTQDSSDFAVCEEGDEHNEHDQGDANDSLQSAASDFGDAFRERSTVNEADDADLQNFEKSQEKGKQAGFQQSRVDERYVFGHLAQVEGLGEDYDLSERQRVDEREATRLDTNVLLGQNYRLVLDQEHKDHPKISGDDEESLRLLYDDLLHGST